MARGIWKGVVSFGLLNVPVTMHTAIHEDEIDFDWLQKGTLEPVGYRRVVKQTGKEVGKDEVVKAVRQANGEYVVLSDEEIASANVKSTHAIELLSFADGKELPFLFFETPYFLAPGKDGEKVYALLREALRKTGKVAIAQFVLHNKQHLAALIPNDKAIVLNTLRWATEVQMPDKLDLPEAGLEANGIKPKELEMATELIERMAGKWEPGQYKDTFRDDVMALVERKVKEGRAQEIAEVKARAPEPAEEQTDLTELLRQSLQGRAPAKPSRPKAPHPAVHASKPSRARASKTVH